MSEFVQTWFPPFAGVCSVAAFLFAMWVRNTSRQEAEDAVEDLRAAVTKKFDDEKAEREKIEAKVVDHDRRLIAVEKGLEAFPTTRDIQNLSKQIADIAGDMKGLNEKVQGVYVGQERQENTLKVINETLMQRDHR